MSVQEQQSRASGVSPLDISKMAGTSLTHIDNTYLKYSEEMAVNAALKDFSISGDDLIVRD